MTKIHRRQLLGGAIAGGAVLSNMNLAQALPPDLKMTDIKKETEIACVYHCDFGDPGRFDTLLRNVNNHLSVYDFNPLDMKIVIVSHGPGVKFFLKDLADTPWANEKLDPELEKRMQALAQYGVDALLCTITFTRLKIDRAKARTEGYIKFVPSGVATVAALQAKGFAYLKVG
jgi:uncharacterized protein